MRSRLATKKYLAWLLLCIPFLLVSCLKDDKVVLDDYCYIQSVTLGNVKRVVKKDTVTTRTSYSATSYRFTIDQQEDSIWNRTPLLYGSQMGAVLVNITYNGSYLSWRPKGEGEWRPYSSKDSMDLSKPVELYLIANNSKTGRVYTLSVNVHSQDPDVFSWNKMEEFEEDKGFSGMTEMRAVMLGEKMLVLGVTEAGVKFGERSGMGKEAEWKFLDTEGLEGSTVCLNTLQQKDGQLYLGTSEGEVFSSADGKIWTHICTHPGLTLIGASDNYFYGLSDKKILRTTDMTDWTQEDALESAYPHYTPADSLPTIVVGTQLFHQDNGNERLMLLGYKGEDTKAVAWNKMWNKKYAEETAEWVFIPRTKDNSQLLPRLNSIVLLPYNGGCAAIGGNLDTVYFTKDYGITWRRDSEITLPAELKEASGPVAAVVENGIVMWIIAKNQVWRGKLNRLG